MIDSSLSCRERKFITLKVRCVGFRAIFWQEWNVMFIFLYLLLYKHLKLSLSPSGIRSIAVYNTEQTLIRERAFQGIFHCKKVVFNQNAAWRRIYTPFPYINIPNIISVKTRLFLTLNMDTEMDWAKICVGFSLFILKLSGDIHNNGPNERKDGISGSIFCCEYEP